MKCDCVFQQPSLFSQGNIPLRSVQRVQGNEQGERKWHKTVLSEHLPTSPQRVYFKWLPCKNSDITSELDKKTENSQSKLGNFVKSFI